MGKGEQMNQGDKRKIEEVPNGTAQGPPSEVKDATGSGKPETATTTRQQDTATEVPTKTATDAPGQAPTDTAPTDTAQTATESLSTKGLSTAQKAGVETIAAGTDQLNSADTDKPEQLAAATNQQLLGYYINGLKQSSSSFRAALAVATAGVVFFIIAIAFLVLTEAPDISVVSAIGGAIVEVIAGLMFYLYGKTTDQLDAYRRSMEQTQRFLLANSIALSLTNMKEEQEKTVATLVNTISQWGRPSSRSRDNDNAPLNKAARRLSSQNKDAGT
jgi:hypothetical protein